MYDVNNRVCCIINCYFLSGSQSSEIEFMQKRLPVGGGPSPNSWPRWASQRPQRASVWIMPNDGSVLYLTLPGLSVSKKLGQPKVLANRVLGQTSASPH